MKIVIVDDDRAAADALAQKLSTFDETQLCGIALNGMDGLRLVNETRPDVLFLDIELPDISGIEFLERANILPQYKCRTVMYTAHDRFMLSAFRNKAFDYLMKPIDDTELRNIIRRVCIEMAGVPDADCTSAAHQPTDTSSSTADIGNYNALDADNGITCHNDGKFIVYTNSVDFRLVDTRDWRAHLQPRATPVGDDTLQPESTDTPEAQRWQRRIALAEQPTGAREPKAHHQPRLPHGGDKQHLPLLSAVR